MSETSLTFWHRSTELNGVMLWSSLCVRMSRNVTGNKRLNLDALILANWQSKLAYHFFFKNRPRPWPSFKVIASNRVRCEVHTDYLPNDDIYGMHCYFHQIGSRTGSKDCHVYIWPWPIFWITYGTKFHSFLSNVGDFVTFQYTDRIIMARVKFDQIWPSLSHSKNTDKTSRRYNIYTILRCT